MRWFSSKNRAFLFQQKQSGIDTSVLNRPCTASQLELSSAPRPPQSERELTFSTQTSPQRRNPPSRVTFQPPSEPKHNNHTPGSSSGSSPSCDGCSAPRLSITSGAIHLPVAPSRSSRIAGPVPLLPPFPLRTTRLTIRLRQPLHAVILALAYDQ